MTAQILLPKILEIGAGACTKVASLMTDMGYHSPLIITDKMMVQLGYVDKIIHSLAENGITAEIFDETVPEPTINSIEAGVAKAHQGQFDCLIALGGGSPIDSAKAIGLLVRHGGQMEDYKFPKQITQPCLPVIAIPTTAGTGSEATRFTIITQESNQEKMLCTGQGLMPIAALVDFELTLSLPPRTTADTGIDALTHAIESYVSKKANPYSEVQALAAMKLIAANLRGAFHEGSDKKAREAMMLGATLAGVAFSNSSVALVHGMSRPIGAAFHVPHGLSNAMLLPNVTRFSVSGSPKRYADCARAMGIANAEDPDDKANSQLLSELLALNKELQVPSLKQFGIDWDEYHQLLPQMAQQALDSGSPANNPRLATKDDIIKIYQSLWQ